MNPVAAAFLLILAVASLFILGVQAARIVSARREPEREVEVEPAPRGAIPLAPENDLWTGLVVMASTVLFVFLFGGALWLLAGGAPG